MNNDKKEIRTSFCVSKNDYSKWEEIMFLEKQRSISSFIRKCVNFYIEENYGKQKQIQT